MAVDLLLGLQWGDEGKGKIVDVLTGNYDIIARFQGGPNAGHTLIFDGYKHVLHTKGRFDPPGSLRPDRRRQAARLQQQSRRRAASRHAARGVEEMGRAARDRTQARSGRRETARRLTNRQTLCTADARWHSRADHLHPPSFP